MSTVAERIKEALGNRHQNWLAAQAGVTTRAVSFWMRGGREPGLDSIAAVAKVLDVSPGWLAFGEGERRTVEWTVRCSCGESFSGTPPVVQAWNRGHDDSPLASHIVSWDVPGVKPWSGATDV